MPDNSSTPSRKADHIRINLEEDVRSALTTGLEKFRFIPQALPEIDLDHVKLDQVLFGKTVRAPILISSMTGGTQEAKNFNRILAEVAQEERLALGVGSQRASLEIPELADTFQIRSFAPDILLFANLGAVQLNYGYSLDHCQRAVDMLEADALILHLNALQEAVQPGGDTRFSNLAAKIEIICKKLPVPVVVKEVGWGISGKTARLLANSGVAAIDVAGAGGTSWTQVEMHRIHDPSQARIAAAFRDWGIPTADSIRMVRTAVPNLPVFASGGLRDGVDIAKCIALGAVLGGMAGPFLRAAASGDAAALTFAKEIAAEIKICMFAVGAATLDDLRLTHLVEDGEKH
ncbi:MAG TPA: type 2 isopentenyl-diphosphate Delta-isomerase [Anaerolineaceae bacterium]